MLLPLLLYIKTPLPPPDPIPAQYQNQTITKRLRYFPTKLIALTYDDGPNPKTTPIILDALKKHNAKATFFVLGANAKKHPNLLYRIAKEGHAIGNHSMSHAKSLPSLEAATQEIQDLNQIITQATDHPPTIFRPPYGLKKSYLSQAALNQGLTSILWTASSADSATTDPEIVFKNVCFTPNPGEIVLLHDIKSHTAKATPKILAHLTEKGFKFVTIPQLLHAWDTHQSTQKPQPIPN